MSDEEVPVPMVGGSLVGLTTAMLLGHHGMVAWRAREAASRDAVSRALALVPQPA
jgi:2-polyprenyl-6-methoxyphenol hydroxylase-like FAD-dependent oxidoreductase